MTLFRSLTNRSFTLLWVGQTTSRLGDSIFSITLAWWILEKTGSAAAMGKMMIFSMIPMLLFTLVGGVVTDRFPRLNVMLISDVIRGVVVAAITVLVISNLLEVWHIYVARILTGIVAAFFQPAYTATIPQIVPKDRLPSANSMTNLSDRGANIFGPAIGAGIVSLGGTSLAFGLNAFSFFISAVCILLIMIDQKNKASTGEVAIFSTVPPESKAWSLRTAFTEFLEGLRTVLSSTWLWISILIFGFVNVTLSPMSVSLPVLIKVNLNADVSTLGLFTSANSIGFVVGSIFLGSFKKIRKRGYLAYGVTAICGLMFAVFGLVKNIPILAVAAFGDGFAISIFALIWTNSLQELVPGNLLGRVASIDALGSFILLPIGYGVAGWATDLIGAPQVFLIGGIATVVLALLGLLHPAIRKMD